MAPFLDEAFANPSSPYTPARRASSAIEIARGQVARLVGAQPEEIVFTSGGTESNNAALYSATAVRPDRRTLVISAVEHPSVLGYARRLETRGYRVIRLGVNREGQPDLDEVQNALEPQTALLSVMAANNETGVCLPWQELADLAARHAIPFHTDAVQVAGKLPLNLGLAGVHTAAFSAHKLHGPKGIGALYIRKGTPFEPLLVGGGQEAARRPGTENVAAIVGFGCAAALAYERQAVAVTHMTALRDTFETALRARCPGLHLAGTGSARLPNTSCLLLPGIDSDALIARLDLDNLCVASGSACQSGAHEPSHVLLAMGYPVDQGWGALRVSISRYTQARDMEVLVDRIAHGVQELCPPTGG